MNQLAAVIILVSFYCAKAQRTSNITNVHDPLHPSSAVVASVFSLTFLIIFLIILYAKFWHTTVLSHFTPRGLVRTLSRNSGIDKTVIESLPVFMFSSLTGSKQGLECVVCLLEFNDTEILRLLPKCRHAFHMNCIDKWLEKHSSCPLCRYKFDVREFASLTCTNSVRCHRNPSNLSEDPNLELFVQREQDYQSSSRINLASSFRKFVKGTKEEHLIQGGRKHLQNFQHKIIVSDIVCRRRWSEVKSSDLIFLNSEMLNVMSSKRFSPLDTNRGVINNGKIPRSRSLSTSSFPSPSNFEANQITTSGSLNLEEKRSMSEIANVPRFTKYIERNMIEEPLFSGNNGRDERMKRLWLKIARRTIHWFAGQEKSSQESHSQKHSSNV